VRTVGTRLTVEAGQAKRELRDAGREARSFEDELVDAARQGDLTAKAVAEIGATAKGAFPVAEKAAARLNDEIAETAREIQRLDREFRKTGDVTLFRDLEKQLRKLKAQIKVRDFFDRRDVEQAGEQLVEGIGVQIMGRLGPVMARAPLNVGALGPVGGAIGAAVAAGVVPILGSAVAGAVIGGAGAGGVVGGLAIAARHPAVQSEAKLLGEEFVALLDRSAQGSMVPAARRAIGTLRKEAAGLEPFLRSIFAKAAGFVDPLLRGAIGLVKNALPGVVAMVERARPVIDVIATRLPEVRGAIADALEDISGDAESAAAGVDLILQGLIGIVRFGGNVIAFLTDMFRIIVTAADAVASFNEQLTANIPIIGDHVANQADRVRGLKDILDGAGQSAKDAKPPFDDLGEVIGRAAEETETLNQAFNDLFDVTMNADQLAIRYKEGLVALKEELLSGKRTLDLNTRAGQENRRAVLEQIGIIAQMRDQRVKETGDVRGANAAYGQHLEALRRTMLQAGFTKAEVNQLINRYKAIPAKVDTTVKVNGYEQALGRIRTLKAEAERFRGTYTATARLNYVITGKPRSVPPGTNFYGGMRWGGVTEHAQTGLLKDAALFSPAGPARYAFAEPATGGEAFIPKRGNFDRSLAIWAKVGRDWLGMRPGGGGVVRVVFDFAGADTQMARALRGMVRVEGGGNVQVALGS
jgi:hypothetical protein